MSDKPKRILVVEDEEDIRDLYVELLQDAGYEVDSAVNGELGIEKMRLGGWDLILLDIVMPQMDGLTVLDLLRTNPAKKPNGSIILLTVLAQDNMIHKGLEKGAAGYLIKSEVTPDQVLEEVRNFLGEK